MQRFTDVIERVEQVRKWMGLNKSRFSTSIGLKPQTYNNFVGKQASKPNIELVVGLVGRYNINAQWLLRGVGPVRVQPDGAGHPESGLHELRLGVDLREEELTSSGPGTPAASSLSSEAPSIERAMILLRDQMALLIHEIRLLRTENQKLSNTLVGLASTPDPGK